MQRHIPEPFDPNLRFDKNECLDFITQKKIIERLDFSDLHRYRSAYDVIKRISKLLHVNPNRVYVDNGSERVIQTLIQHLDVGGYDVPIPTFEMFSFYCKLYNKRINRLNIEHAGGCVFRYKLNTIESAFYMPSPHNPTGMQISDAQLAELCKLYKYVIIDEAYVNPLSLLKPMASNLIIIRTFSKMGGFAGIRFGFCIAPENIVHMLNQQRPMYINTVALKVVEALCQTPSLLRDLRMNLELTARTIVQDFCLTDYVITGNFITALGDIKFYGKPVKRYIFSETPFTRITLCDIKTYHRIANESIH